ncbi:permease prefix domain 1-containing protein [Peptostreptococcus faecalis]|uniref:permease prefix domain 1-containing protein n=1 Tax=Peptostreptococcus faecalis TaxID=2045015 RepID=UPI000C7CEF98|nr:permease prefix domain 1-containing protein [Peptostreptococcus faecalis]
MDVIRNYLEMSFSGYPNTPELTRLKEEMYVNMEEKYNELKRNGKSENEAIGEVIAEFGNIEEIANELGIGKNIDDSIDSDKFENREYELSLDDANSYIYAKVKASVYIGIGVALCILGAASLVGLSSFIESNIADTLGVIVLLMFVAIAVGLFVYAGSITDSWEFIEKENIIVNAYTEREVKIMQDEQRPIVMKATIISVALYILSPVVVILSNLFEDNVVLEEEIALVGVVILLVMVAIATATLIIVHSKKSACDAILNENEYSREKKAVEKNKNIIGSIWWPVTTIIFFVIGFFGEGFSRAWIIWPISGILFAAVSTIITSIQKDKN